MMPADAIGSVIRRTVSLYVDTISIANALRCDAYIGLQIVLGRILGSHGNGLHVNRIRWTLNAARCL